MNNPYWTNEKECVNYAREMCYQNHKTHLIFKKERNYLCVQGELFQDSTETFKNVFGEIRHYSEESDIRRKYEEDGYELRGWVGPNGCFKNN